MKKYKITLLLSDGREFEKVSFFESYEAAKNDAKKAFDKVPAVIAYAVDCLDE